MRDTKKTKSRSRKPDCPKCGKRDMVVRILYGYPSSEAAEEAKAGKIVLGGCLIGKDDPEFFCKRCEISFGNIYAKQEFKDL